MGKVIAAIATPLGEGSIGTVRVSGDGAIAVCDKVFCSASGKRLSDMDGYTALFGKVIYDGKVLDQAVALVFKAPKSYTGEDVVELSVHGGDFVVRSVLRAVLWAGAVLAERGEFTRRAYLNGKMDLSQAEAVMDIISAEGEQSLRASVEAYGGAVTKNCRELKENLTFAAATVAAFSDFPDEEPEFSGIDKLEQMLSKAEDEFKRLILDYDKGRMIKKGINTVIVGPPNAGKSTLMNLLSGFDRSIVTAVAGTTRDMIEETVNLGDVVLRLCDTAGIRETEDEVEKIGVQKTLEKLDSADLIIVVLDGSADKTEYEGLLDSVKGRNTVVVFNKSDIKESDKSAAKDRGLLYVTMSAKNGDGLSQLIDVVKNITGTASLSGDSSVFLNERQRDCAIRALNSVSEALSTLTAGFTVDAVGVCLDDALAALMELTGERVTVEVADQVFTHFCVGK